jgi:rhamnosyltransferase
MRCPDVRISLVMPTLDGGPLLDEVLDAVLSQRGTTFAELVAIDSGSRDGTVERLQRRGFRVLGIPKREFDHGGTRDRGIAATTGDIVVLLVQDATMQGQDWLARMVEPFADPDVAGVWCRQVPRPKCQPVLARRIRGWPGWGEGVTVKRLPPGQRLADLPPFEQLMLCAFDNVASAIRRTAWQRFPLGPRRFGEDVWFGKRVIESGGALAHQGGAVVVHSHDRSAFAEGRRTFCDHRNLRRLFGLVGIPTRAALDGAIVHATKEHLDYVRSLGLPKDEEAKALRWTERYVLFQCWGQFLGARAGADLPSPEGTFLRLLGRRLERGIG